MWNVCTRDMERDLIPMCRAHGMAIAPWNVLVQGKIRTDEEEEERRDRAPVMPVPLHLERKREDEFVVEERCRMRAA